MRRVRWYEYGGPEVLRVEDAAIPEPGPGQVRIRAEAIGVNYVDTLFRRGPGSGAIFQRPLPGRPTGDVVGTVDAVGAGVDPGLTGRRVGALVAEDAYADHVLADADWLAPIPGGVDDAPTPGVDDAPTPGVDDAPTPGVDDATATALAGTAPVALGVLRAGRLSDGDTVLVHGAAGGVGHLIVQLARLLGAGTVIGAASTPAKLAHTGVDVAIDSGAADWPERVGPVDLVLDATGGDTLLRSLDLLAPGGRAVTYGSAGGALVSVPVTSLFRLRSVHGFALLTWRESYPEQARADLAELTEYAADGRLRAAVHARLPLTDAAEAHRIFEAREQTGRVLLVP